MPEFRTVCIATSILSLALFLALTFLPPVMYWIFGMEGSTGADVMIRRAGILFIGYGIILWRLRGVGEGDTRMAIATGMTLTMGAMALIGLFEFFRGTVGPGIFLAVMTEAVLCALFLRHAHRRQTRSG